MIAPGRHRRADFASGTMRLLPTRLGFLYLLPLAVLLMAANLRLGAPDLLGRPSLIAFDAYQRCEPRLPTKSPVAIVDIDDMSLAKIGQWPWSRTIVAALVDRLARAGAAVVAFDIDFAEPDRTSPQLVPRSSCTAVSDSSRPKRRCGVCPIPTPGSRRRCARSR
jgi:adenylate cyclase